MKIITQGRTDIDSFFEMSGSLTKRHLKMYPFIVFNEQPSTDNLLIDIVDNAKDLLSYADNVKVMAQWGGQWSSDFFQFTVGQVRKYMQEHNL